MEKILKSLIDVKDQETVVMARYDLEDIVFDKLSDYDKLLYSAIKLALYIPRSMADYRHAAQVLFRGMAPRAPKTAATGADKQSGA